MIKLLLRFNEESRELELADESITIGRSSENVISMSDRKASRKHARIEKNGAEYRICDLGSGNGTRVNGKEVDSHILARGDEIKIGLTTLYVLDVGAPAVPAPAVVAPLAPAPERAVFTVEGPVARAPAPAVPAVAEAAPAPAEPAPAQSEAAKPDAAQAPPEPKLKITRRARYQGRSGTGGKIVAAAAALIILGAVAYAGVFLANLQSGRPTSSISVKKAAVTPAEAEAAYKDFQARADADLVTESLISEAGEKAQKFGAVYPAFDTLVDQLRHKREEQIGKMTFAEVETVVAKALKEKRYGDAVEALRPLRYGADATKSAALLKQVTTEVTGDFKAVDELGKKFVDQKSYDLAIRHYREQSPRFKGTEYYKTLVNKTETLEDLVKAEDDAARAREQKANAPPPVKPEVEIAKATPKPVPAEAPKPEMKPEPKPAPKPEPKPAPKPEPKMEPPKPAPKPPPPPPPPPKPEAKPEPKPDAPKGAFKKPDVLCPCKRTVKGMYCIKCDRVLEQDDLRKNLCKRCEEAPKKVDMCVRKYFQADCHPDKTSDKPFE